MAAQPEPLPLHGPTLLQRLLAIAAEIDIIPTGDSAFKKGERVVSIQDIENSLRPLFAKHGVVSLWHTISADPIEGGKDWKVALGVQLLNGDDADDTLHSRWEDTGSAVASAASYARKGFYKALFHIDEPEKAQRVETRQPAPKPAPKPDAKPIVVAEVLEARNEARATLQRAARALGANEGALFEQVRAGLGLGEIAPADLSAAQWQTISVELAAQIP